MVLPLTSYETVGSDYTFQVLKTGKKACKEIPKNPQCGWQESGKEMFSLVLWHWGLNLGPPAC